MDSYPFGMTGLLLAPPPPPPPSTPSNTRGTLMHQGLPDSVGSLSHRMSGPSHSQAMPMVMIPPSHLGLPPPPPPPPPEAIDSTSSAGLLGMPSTPTDVNAPISNFVQCPTHKAPPHGKPLHPSRSGVSPWISQTSGPSGLQGPWQAPSCERPLRALEILHPPGVSTFDHSEEDRGSLEANSEQDAILERNNFSTPLVASSYKEHRGDPKHPALPKELTNLFEALHCKLCEVLSSSTVQAKHHYSGRPHERKVRQWLQKWSEETGQPMPKRQKIELVDINPEDLYCKVCDVTFTSVKHGEEHKMGKPHQKALRLGYSTAKSKTKKLEVPIDPTGRFGIGETFQKNIKKSSSEGGQPEIEPNASTSTPATKCLPSSNKFFCQLCQISTTSQDHLDSHYAGAKHRKNLVNAARSGIKSKVSVVPPAVEPSESILASVISDGNVRPRCVSNDLSIYRTPSGKQVASSFIIIKDSAIILMNG